MCSRNGGLFIKVGQHIGALEYLFPREYVHTFKLFHSEAPQTSLDQIVAVIEEELGQPGTCILNTVVVKYGNKEDVHNNNNYNNKNKNNILSTYTWPSLSMDVYINLRATIVFPIVKPFTS